MRKLWLALFVMLLAVSAGAQNTFPSSGNAGIGTTNPISRLTLAGTGNPNPNTGSQIDYSGENLTFVNNTSAGNYELGGIRVVQPTGYYVDRGNMVFTVGIGGSATLDAVTIQAPMGNVGIGTTSPGAKLEVNGNVKLSSGSGASITFPDSTVQSTAWTGTLCGGDYAESVDISGDRTKYGPGDVLVVDPASPGHFLKAAEPYSTLVAGIYSTKPGLVGRRQTSDPKIISTEVPMAMVGIVPTKVSTENGPIKPGDLLVTSSTVGHAMKGTDRGLLTGAIVGKALGTLQSGTGVIEVLVSLQ